MCITVRYGCSPVRTRCWSKIAHFATTWQRKSTTWLKKGKIHRLHGPAAIKYWQYGSVFWEAWYVEGKRHRKYCPALVRYGENGSIKEEIGYLKGEKGDVVFPKEIY